MPIPRRLPLPLFGRPVALLLVLFLATLGACDPTEEEPDPEPIVATSSGMVRGASDGAVRRFLGIPYAAAPTGERRFALPVAPAKWRNVRAVQTPAPTCVQPDGSGQEDCLTLNIWTPDPAPHDAPVVFYVHGGGFSSGSASDPRTAPERLVERGVIVVAANYRLGPLGFLAHPELERINVGLADQQMALRWVRAHIGAFGGDPSRITVMGASSGAVSACLLAARGGAESLAGMILHSGPCVGFPFRERSHAEKEGSAMATALGCQDLACLRTVDAAQLVQALPEKPGYFVGPGTTWFPVVDELLVPADLAGALRQTRLPVMMGTTTDEGTMFAGMAGYTQPEVSQPITDSFHCWDEMTAQAWGGPVYRFRFEYAWSVPAFPFLGAFHASDVAIVFGSDFIGATIGAVEEKLGAQMRSKWTRFADSGAPGWSAGAQWLWRIDDQGSRQTEAPMACPDLSRLGEGLSL